MSVVIRGGGVAAVCLDRLLREAGLEAALESSRKIAVPALLIGARSQALMQGLFPGEDLFGGLPRIASRIVLWGEATEPSRVAHAAAVIAETELSERLRARVSQQRGRQAAQDWTVFASGQLSEPCEIHGFGERTATVVSVRLSDRAEGGACWIEAARDGWLFLLPGEAGSGSLITVGAAQPALLSQSRLVTPRISSIGDTCGPFPAFPAISDPLCGPGWLACGRAALSFDPLCGDGTGNSIREAILASAVLRAAFAGEDRESLLSHYKTRLTSAFLKHLEISRPFYGAGGDAPWWREQTEALDRGIEFCRKSLEGAGPPRYRLSGFDLAHL